MSDLPSLSSFCTMKMLMARMTAEMELMSCQRTALSAQTRMSSSVATRDVCPSDGCVTLKMTVETTAMRMSPCALEDTESAPSLSSSVTMTSVSHLDGAVTWMMTVMMAVTRLVVLTIAVHLARDNVTQVCYNR